MARTTIHLAGADGTPLCDADIDTLLVQTSSNQESAGHVCRRCQKKMEKELTTLARLRALKTLDVGNLDSPDKWAKAAFFIVPHGWQFDVEIHTEDSIVTKGSICRDWGDTGPSARRLLTKLVKMGKTGAP